MPFRARSGGRLHRTRACRYVTPRHQRVGDVCSVCWDREPPPCVACGVKPMDVVFTCHHGYCEQCAIFLVDTAIVDHVADVRCPCPRRGALHNVRELPTDALVARVEALESRRPPTSATVLADDATRLQVDACPHCGSLFVDYNGCAAVQCECSKWFCALCLAPFEGSDDAHCHVADCTGNGTTFLPFDTWRARRTRARVAHFVSATARTIAFSPVQTFARTWILVPYLQGPLLVSAWALSLLCVLWVQCVLVAVSVLGDRATRAT